VIGQGIEIFRQRGEPLADFFVKDDTLGIALSSKGMREIAVSSALLFRNRTTNSDLVDEEMFSWSDCLRRFDVHVREHAAKPFEPQSEQVRRALLSHQSKEAFEKVLLE
jgi:hypothetical protein